MKKIKNRIFKNWRSSLVGLFLVICCFICVLLGKATFLDVTPVILVGVGLLGVKDPRNVNLKMIFVVAGVSLLLLSCSPETRLKRLLKHHPELTKKDTITYRDTFYFPELKFDTIFKTNFDTIKIDHDRFKIQLLKKDSLIYLNYVYPSDTVSIEKKIPVDKIIYPPIKKNYSKLLGALLALAIGAILAFVLFRNRYSKF